MFTHTRTSISCSESSGDLAIRKKNKFFIRVKRQLRVIYVNKPKKPLNI